MATPPTATGLAVALEPGGARVSWTLPVASPVNTVVQFGLFTDAAFTAPVNTTDGLVMTTSYNAAPTTTAVPFHRLAPNTTYYFRVRGNNGTAGAYASISFTTPVATPLDNVEVASVSVGDGVVASLRFDPATGVTSLGYSTLTGGTTWTSIATIGTIADYDARRWALVADPDGNLYVIGRVSSAMVARRYARTGTTNVWTLAGVLSQDVGFGLNPVRIVATWVPGTGGTPRPSILVVVRFNYLFSGGLGGYLTIDPARVAASSGTMAIASASWADSNAFVPGAGALGFGASSTPIDLAPLAAGSNRVAIYYNGVSVVDVTNGVLSSVSKGASAGTLMPLAKVYIVGIDVTRFAALTVKTTGELSVAFYSTNGSLLGTVDIGGVNAWGGAFDVQWAAFYDAVDGVIRVYYVADDSARKVESVDVSPLTYTAAAAVIVSTTLGAASSVNDNLRVPRGLIDERKILLEANNTLAGVQSLATLSDTQGNAVPTAPTTDDVAGFDASQAYVLGWTFGDPNPADSQTAYELEVQRVSDSVVVVSSGKVASTVSNRTIAAATLTNGVAYRWRVRTYDELDTIGAWSAYDAFATAATGTLTITLPVADTTGLDVATYDVTWTYVQGNGYVQTQRRVRVIRVSDSVVLTDTTMQASAVMHYVVSLPTGIAVRVEVSIVTNAPGTPTIGPTLRLITSTYSDPMPPTAVLTLGDDCIDVVVTNPAPTGSRPEVVRNGIERRFAGEVDFVRVGSVGYNGEYHDHAVKSGAAYEYRIVGITA